MGPETMTRLAAPVFRFERACWLIKQRLSLAEAAAASGYYDQAHMNHEWRALAGCAPQAWMAAQLPLLQDYEVADTQTRLSGTSSSKCNTRLRVPSFPYRALAG